MYTVNSDLSIYVTRGDAMILAVGANNNGVPYVFQSGEVVRFRVFEKKGCHRTVLQKDFIITDAVESVDIVLTKEETKIGEIISKPKDYWYEIELNPDCNPQTIVGYDEDGPKVFRLFPEGADTEGGEGQAPDEFVPAIKGGLLPYVTEEDNGKTVVVVDGDWQPVNISGLTVTDDGQGNIRFLTGTLSGTPDPDEVGGGEPTEHTLSGAVVTVDDADAVGLPLEITASDTASKVYVGGKNRFPSTDANGQSLFVENEEGELELIVDDDTKANAYYRVIDLGMLYPAEAYSFCAEVETTATDADGNPLETACTIRLFNDTTMVAAGELKVNRGSLQNVALSPYPTGSEYQQFNKIHIYSGSGNTGSTDVNATFKKVFLCPTSIYTAGEYVEADNSVFTLPVDGLTVESTPLYLFADDGTSLDVTYYTPAVSDDTDTNEVQSFTNEVQSLTLNDRTYNSFRDLSARDEIDELRKVIEDSDGGGGADAGTSVDLLPNEYYFEDDDLPQYLPKKVEEINDLIRSAALNGDAFIFITDMHTERGEKNGGQAPALIKYICDNTKVRRVFTGGDLALTLAQHTAVGESLEKAIGVDIHSAMGNHEYDVVKQVDGDIVPRMTEADLYYVYDINKLNQVSGNAARHYYYVDNPQQKIRYVAVNNWMHKSDATTSSDGVKAENIEGSVDEQATWLTDTAFNVEAGWGIILFCHQFYNDPGASEAAGVAVPFREAIDKYEGPGEIIAVFHGHIHRDMVNYTSSGVPAIGVMADKTHTGLAVNNEWKYEVAYQQDTTPATGTDGQYWLDTATNPHSVKVYSSANGMWHLVPEEEVNLLIPRYKGTITEQAFDVVVVDRTARKIHCVRIGAPAVGGNGAFTNVFVETRVVDF